MSAPRRMPTEFSAVEVACLDAQRADDRKRFRNRQVQASRDRARRALRRNGGALLGNTDSGGDVR